MSGSLLVSFISDNNEKYIMVWKWIIIIIFMQWMNAKCGK